MDAIYPIVRHVHAFASEAMPARVIAVTKRFIFDSIAVMMAGSRADGCAVVADYARQWSGPPQATMVTGDRAPAPYAAMANSMMAHAVEFDDTYEPADVHGYAVVLPAVLAVAELSTGCAVSGRDIIVATAIGVDLAYRLGAAIKVYRGWQPTSTCGNLGATLAAGRIAGCDAGQLHNAVGIAYGLVAGNFQAVVDGSLTKRLQPGFSARAAVESVLLARAGITGAKDVLQGTFGFFNLYEAGEYDIGKVTEGLGARFLGELASMKPYPCCRFCHAGIDAALRLAEDFNFPAGAGDEAIAQVEVDIPAETYDYVGRPFAGGDNPTVAAQFSVPYTVACAILRRRVGLDEFSLRAVHDPAVCSLARRVTARPVPADRYGAVTVRVQLRSGRLMHQRVEVMKGEPDNPLSDAERLDKARACIAYGGYPAAAFDALAFWADSLEQNAAPLPQLHSIFRTREGS
jgi:2-methylcitrate dehydratase PrpD